ncbi:hypothetical protein BN1110_06284 [bacterium YEK0313]|nr:hypothetical protein BN1110_06284 [bacterium YEK0313]
MLSYQQFRKTPAERLDYDLDYSAWLTASDRIDTAVATVTDAGATVDTVDIADTTVKVWVAGGAAPENARINVRATTLQGRVKDVTFTLMIRER